MFNRNKVVPLGKENSTKVKNEEDQKKYAKKVDELRTACANFGKYLNTEVTAETKISKIAEKFGKVFEKQMKKVRLFSRTSKLLNEMKNKLLKLKSKSKNGEFGTVDDAKIDQYKKVFEFKQENPKGGYIKRSAIDDIEVYNFFNTDKDNSILGILTEMKNEYDNESKKLKEFANGTDKTDGIFKEVENSLKESKQIMDNTNTVQKEIEKIQAMINSQKIDQEYKNEIQSELDTQIKKLQQCIKASKKAITDLEEEQKQTKKVMDDKNLTNGEKWVSLNALYKAKEINKKVNNELENENTKTTEINAGAEKSIKRIREGNFDSRTGIFIIKTKDDFRNSKDYKNKIRKIVIKGKITTIGDGEFSGYTSLRSVDLGSVTTIENSAFSGCSSLGSIDFKNVETIGTLAFSSCTSLQSIDFKDVTTIGNLAFWDCKSLQNIDLKNVETIGNSAFLRCSSLQSIDFKDVTTIGTLAFSSCTSLQNIDLKSVENIGAGAFSSCTSLENVTLGDSTTIGYNREFQGCISLKSINFKNVAFIDKPAFSGYKALKTIDLSNVVGVQDNAFDDCTDLTTVTLPLNKKDAAKIKEAICKQTGKNPGDGKKLGTINFINDPEPAEKK